MTNEEHRSESLFEGEGAAPRDPAPKSTGAPAKVAIVAALVAVVAGVIVLKEASGLREQPGTRPPSADTTSGQAGARAAAFDAETVLAAVEGEQITLAELEDAQEALPAEYRSAFARQKHAFLDELIARKLLVQQARARNVAETDAYREGMAAHEAHPGHEEHVLIDVLLRQEVLDELTVTEEDLRSAYEEVKGELPPGTSLEEVKDQLRAYVRQDKQNKAIETYLADLREEAAITRNEEWIETQQARAADNPLDRALQKDVPVVADFGQGTCIPCKMMKPILEDLKDEYAGRAEILIIETDEYPAVARRVGIRVIPTQIFYDAEGNEVARHEGFMPREAIVDELAELGVQ